MSDLDRYAIDGLTAEEADAFTDALAEMRGPDKRVADTVKAVLRQFTDLNRALLESDRYATDVDRAFGRGGLARGKRDISIVRDAFAEWLGAS